MAVKKVTTKTQTAQTAQTQGEAPNPETRPEWLRLRPGEGDKLARLRTEFEFTDLAPPYDHSSLPNGDRIVQKRLIAIIPYLTLADLTTLRDLARMMACDAEGSAESVEYMKQIHAARHAQSAQMLADMAVQP